MSAGLCLFKSAYLWYLCKSLILFVCVEVYVCVLLCALCQCARMKVDLRVSVLRVHALCVVCKRAYIHKFMHIYNKHLYSSS